MLPALICAGIWGYDLYKFLELKYGNSLHRKEQDERKSLDIFEHCKFNLEDRRVYNHFDRCVINVYLTGGKDEKHIKGKSRGDSHILSEMAEQEGENLRKRKSFMQDPFTD